MGYSEGVREGGIMRGWGWGVGTQWEDRRRGHSEGRGRVHNEGMGEEREMLGI